MCCFRHSAQRLPFLVFTDVLVWTLWFFIVSFPAVTQYFIFQIVPLVSRCLFRCPLSGCCYEEAEVILFSFFFFYCQCINHHTHTHTPLQLYLFTEYILGVAFVNEEATEALFFE